MKPEFYFVRYEVEFITIWLQGLISRHDRTSVVAGNKCVVGESSGKNENLLQALDQIKVAEGAMETIDVGLAVRGHQDGPDSGDAGGIDRNNLLPESLLSCGQFQLVDLGGHLAGAVNVQGAAVLIPGDRLVSGFKTIHDSRLAARCGIEIAFLVGANSRHPLAIR